MEGYLLPGAVGVAVFIVILLFFQRRVSSDQDRRKRTMLEQASLGTDVIALENEGTRTKITGVSSFSVPPFMLKIPGVRSTLELILKAGMRDKIGLLAGATLVLFCAVFFLCRNFGIFGVLIALAVAFFVPRIYLANRIKSRNQTFVLQFPDAVDMIVRSVRSGHPLNAAMRMIAENMDNPIREEFKQVVDEVSYGRTLPEALGRMAERIDEQDLHFFVVVLSVQQETGGNLAEVLSNLSGIIRKRRQLMLKIQALTSEGRITSWILGGLPVVEFLALYLLAPDYLHPLFITIAGNIILVVASLMILGAMWIVRVMIDIDI